MIGDHCSTSRGGSLLWDLQVQLSLLVKHGWFCCQWNTQKFVGVSNHRKQVGKGKRYLGVPCSHKIHSAWDQDPIFQSHRSVRGITTWVEPLCSGKWWCIRGSPPGIKPLYTGDHSEWVQAGWVRLAGNMVSLVWLETRSRQQVRAISLVISSG